MKGRLAALQVDDATEHQPHPGELEWDTGVNRHGMTLRGTVNRRMGQRGATLAADASSAGEREKRVCGYH